MDYNLDYACPFFKYAQKKCVSCEAGILRMPENETREYLGRYCANMPGYKSCTLATELFRYYDKKERRK